MPSPDSLSCSPPQLLSHVGSARQSASRSRHTRSLRFATAFHSPPWLCPFERLREGSPLPACCFSTIPNPAFQPVRFATPGLAPLLHCLRGADPRSVPVAGRRSGTPWPLFSLHSPLGRRPSGSTCLPTPAWEALLRPQPDLHSLPAADSVLSLPASDHRSRFAVACEACCSF
jgi:hypothetical protein